MYLRGTGAEINFTNDRPIQPPIAIRPWEASFGNQQYVSSSKAPSVILSLSMCPSFERDPQLTRLLLKKGNSIMKQFAVLSLGTVVLWLAAAPAFAQSFNINGTEVRPFYESTPTGRVDDNLVPATDRFNMLESSTAVGLSFSLGGSGRSLVLPGILATLPLTST